MEEDTQESLMRIPRKKVETAFTLVGSNLLKIKNDLECFGCVYDSKSKTYTTPKMKYIDYSFKRIQSITTAFSIEMLPIKE